MLSEKKKLAEIKEPKKQRPFSQNSSSDSDEADEELLKECSVTSDWILNKQGVYEDEKQKNAPLQKIVPLSCPSKS